MNNLDIRDAKETGDMLKVAIVNAVADTQKLFEQTLPSVLTMTKAQYMTQQNDPNIMHAFESKDHLYRTPLNVMEVVIKD